MMTCSAPDDCAELERRHATGAGLLVDGGSSRGNLLSGEADQVILTVSRIAAEKSANPGYRGFLANGYNATRALVLFSWEVVLEWVAAAARSAATSGRAGTAAATTVPAGGHVRRRPRPDRVRRAHRHDEGPARRSTRRSRATTRSPTTPGSSAPTRSRRCASSTSSSAGSTGPGGYAPRPYEIVVLSDHGQTQGATFKQRNGYGLDDLVRGALAAATVGEMAQGDEQHAMAALALGEATGRGDKPAKPADDVEDRDAIVLGSGNLGLIYLMEEKRRLTLEEIDRRHPG